MKILAIIFLCVTLCLRVLVANSQNEKIENFTLTNAFNNARVSLYDFSNAKVVVVIFTSNHCPYSKLYENRIITLAKQFESSNVQFLTINSNSGSNDFVEEMKKKSYPFPYLSDKQQKVCNQFGAAKTPEAFVLHNKNGNFYLVYKGAIDDNPQVENDVNNHYLKNAIEAIINGSQPALKEKRATGCVIK